MTAMRDSPTHTVLLVCPTREARTALTKIFKQTQWRVCHAQNCREAVAYLAGEQMSAVICESALPDGDWRSILHHVHRTPSGPPLIVTSSSADEALWAEVLNLGGFDVLAQPFDVVEVGRVTDAATRYTSRSAAPLQAAVRR